LEQILVFSDLAQMIQQLAHRYLLQDELVVSRLSVIGEAVAKLYQELKPKEVLPPPEVDFKKLEQMTSKRGTLVEEKRI